MASGTLKEQKEEPNEKAESREPKQGLLPACLTTLSGYVASITVDHSSGKADSAYRFIDVMLGIVAAFNEFSPLLWFPGWHPLTLQLVRPPIRAEAMRILGAG